MQFDVEVTSRYLPCVGIHASMSNLRAALEPRSPVATSMTRYGIVQLVEELLLPRQEAPVLGDGVRRGGRR